MSLMAEQSPLIVVALGGNALSREDEEGNIAQQFRHMRETAVHLADLIEFGHRIVITHGNGPQVGNIVRRSEIAADEIYTLPLDICVADTQGGMGYMIALCLNNELALRGVDHCAVAIITTVEVDAEDPAFTRPTKPIGSYYAPDRADELMRANDWEMIEVRDRGFRRVVPSPRPLRIVEIELIRRLVEAGELILAAGGGGIPVVRSDNGHLVGREAVIDKDRTATVLADALGAQVLLMVTSVNCAALDFGTSDEKPLARLTIDEARTHLDARQFPPGSMGPKVEAAIDFILRDPSSNRRVVICAVSHMVDALAGRSGTTISK